MTLTPASMGTDKREVSPERRDNSGYLYDFSAATSGTITSCRSRTTRPIRESPILIGPFCRYSGDEQRAPLIDSSCLSSSTIMIEQTGESNVSATISEI